MWAKPLADGSRVAVLLLNLRDEAAAVLSASFADVGLPPTAQAAARDLWAQRDLGSVFNGSFTTPTPISPHGSMVVTLRPISSQL